MNLAFALQVVLTGLAAGAVYGLVGTGFSLVYRMSGVLDFAHGELVTLPIFAFLFVIGVVLIADGFDHHVPKGYVYFAMAFSVCVEMLNLRMRKRAARPVELHDRYTR